MSGTRLGRAILTVIDSKQGRITIDSTRYQRMDCIVCKATTGVCAGDDPWSVSGSGKAVGLASLQSGQTYMHQDRDKRRQTSPINPTVEVILIEKKNEGGGKV